jgi:hypothetical protein
MKGEGRQCSGCAQIRWEKQEGAAVQMALGLGCLAADIQGEGREGH